MKKVIVAMLGVLMFAPAIFADNWGLGLKLGVGENDPKDLKDTYDSAIVPKKEFDKGYGYFGLEALYEWNLDESNKIVGRIGWDFYGENEADFKSYGEIKEKTYAFPFTVYYKRDNGVKKWSWFAGAGLTIIRTEIDVDLTGFDRNEKKTKVFPHIVAGGEYRLPWDWKHATISEQK